MLLVHPPVVRPCEAPAGIASLAGFLRRCGQACRVVDLNLEGLRRLIEDPFLPEGTGDTWTRRALKNRTERLAQLSAWETYGKSDRHGNAVRSLNRVLSAGTDGTGIRITLADYSDTRFTPLRSADLIRAAEQPEQNPFYPFFSRRLAALIERENPRIIGLSLNYLTQALCAFAIIGYLKNRHPHVKIILGGGLVTSWLTRPDWQNPFTGLADALVPGPGEPYLKAVMNLEEGMQEYPPDYGDFPLTQYLAPGFILPYSASRGCWWRRCTFCPEKTEASPFQTSSPEKVRSDLQRLAAAEHPILIHFLDNALTPALLESLTRYPPGIPWYGFARFTPALRDPDFCRALKNAGCVLLKLGLESGDQGVLDSLDKGFELGDALESLKQLHLAGIGTYVYLLFGTPAETSSAAVRTMDFVARRGEWIDFLNVSLFNLPAFSREAESLDTFPFYPGDLSLYANFHHPRGWNRGLVRRFLDKEFRRHPAIMPILRRDPACFTSNHAPLFLMRGKRKR